MFTGIRAPFCVRLVEMFVGIFVFSCIRFVEKFTYILRESSPFIAFILWKLSLVSAHLFSVSFVQHSLVSSSFFFFFFYSFFFFFYKSSLVTCLFFVYVCSFCENFHWYPHAFSCIVHASTRLFLCSFCGNVRWYSRAFC